ncbi:HMWP1 nonribosomal peptide/polyketide synthase domain protein, partial [Yersinia pestis PY-01]
MLAQRRRFLRGPRQLVCKPGLNENLLPCGAGEHRFLIP